MALTLLVIVFVGPLAELAVAFRVAAHLGGLNTVLLIVALSTCGVLMLRVEGLAAMRQIRQDLNAGRSPGRGLVSGGLRLTGAVLLALPGFVSAAVGILLLLAPVRAVLTPLTMAWLARRATTAASRWRISQVIVGPGAQGPGFHGPGVHGPGFNGPGTHNGHNAPGDAPAEFIDADGWEIEDRTALPSAEDESGAGGGPNGGAAGGT